MPESETLEELMALREKISDLENTIQGQQKEINLIKEIFIGMGVSRNYFSNIPVSHKQSEKHP